MLFSLPEALYTSQHVHLGFELISFKKSFLSHSIYLSPRKNPKDRDLLYSRTLTIYGFTAQLLQYLQLQMSLTNSNTPVAVSLCQQ